MATIGSINCSFLNTLNSIFNGMEVQVPRVVLQKAVRVTTIMKRLRAPEQSDSRANSPAAGATAPPPAGPSCPPPSATVPEGAAPAETPAGGETSQPPPEAAAAAALEPHRLSPAVQEVDPASRCNGESSTATETGKEQG